MHFRSKNENQVRLRFQSDGNLTKLAPRSDYSLLMVVACRASQVERMGGGGRNGFSHPEGGAQTVLRYFGRGALKF